MVSFKVRTKVMDYVVMAFAHQFVMPLLLLQFLTYLLNFKDLHLFDGPNGGEADLIYIGILFNIFVRISSLFVAIFLVAMFLNFGRRLRVAFLEQELVFDGDNIIERYGDEEEHRGRMSNVYAFVETKKRFMYFRSSGYSNAFRKDQLSAEEIVSLREQFKGHEVKWISVAARSWALLLLLYLASWLPALLKTNYHDAVNFGDTEVYASANEIYIKMDERHVGSRDVFWENAVDSFKGGNLKRKPKLRSGARLFHFKDGAWSTCAPIVLPSGVSDLRWEVGKFVANQYLGRGKGSRQFELKGCEMFPVANKTLTAEDEEKRYAGKLDQGAVVPIHYWDQGESEIPTQDGSGRYKMSLTIGGKPIVLVEDIAVTGSADRLETAKVLRAEWGGKDEKLFEGKSAFRKIGAAEYKMWFVDGYVEEVEP